MLPGVLFLSTTSSNFMNLAIDLGNTFAKAGFFDGDILSATISELVPAKLKELIEEKQPEQIIIGAVAKKEVVQEIVNAIPQKTNCLIADHTTPIPVNNLYETPATLGMDRLAAAIGANFLFPDDTCLVIDCGTCITFDIIDRQGYQGGAISPGLNMKFKALNTFTAHLPFLEANIQAPLVGKNTSGAIQSGVVNGTVAEIEDMIRKFSLEFSNLKTIICGGDANFFESKIKATIFVVPELVLIGLNRILLYNVSDK